MRIQTFPYGSSLMNLGGIAVLSLFIARIITTISFNEPLHVVTSGCEEESLFAMWKWINGQAIYSNPHQIPFAASYFNWFFYAFYGTIISFLMKAFHLSDVWLPTVGRLITLAIVSIGCWMNFRLLKFLPRTLAACLSLFVWFGPLIGYWAITVRPDLLGLFFDFLAIFFLLKYLPTRPLLAILIAALGCYLSWSCKQVNIVTPIAIVLSLIWDKQWRLAFIFSISLWTAYALTFWLATPDMLNALFFARTAIPISMDVFVSNLLSFIKKSLPFLALFGLLTLHRQWIKDPMSKLGWCGLIAWACTLLPFSSKVGSADNYHFIALFFLLLVIAPSLAIWLKKRDQRAERALALSGLVLILSIGVAFTNGTFRVLQQQHETALILKDKLKNYPAPVFVSNLYGALPWMHTSAPSFLLNYNYNFDRQAGERFEENGIGGLIEKGYFNALILPLETEKSFDQGLLNHYRQLANPGVPYAVFIKKEPV